MATYEQLHTLFNDEVLLRRVQVAIIEAARIVGAGEDSVPPFSQVPGDHDARIRWAGRAIMATGEEARSMFKLVLAANKGATVGQIQGVSDAAIQTGVNGMVDVVAKALALAK